MGMGYLHEQKRIAALNALIDGELCWRCHRPMYHAQRLDLDHTIPIRLGGIDSPTVLAHASCNRRAGARLRNRLYGSRYTRRTRRVVNRW